MADNRFDPKAFSLDPLILKVSRRDQMGYFMMSVLVAFLCLSSLASAITLDDTDEIQNSIKSLVDGSQIKKINVSVLPPDGIIFNITASSGSIFTARLSGVIAFSNLTYYYPEVVYGWIGIFLDNAAEPVFIDIYSNELIGIADKRHTSLSEALKIVNNIIKRGTQTSITIKPASAYSTAVISKPRTNLPDTVQSDPIPIQTVQSGSYPANSKTKVYHEPGCSWADKIKPGNLVWFNSHQQAEASGYRHCQKC